MRSWRGPLAARSMAGDSPPSSRVGWRERGVRLFVGLSHTTRPGASPQEPGAGARASVARPRGRAACLAAASRERCGRHVPCQCSRSQARSRSRRSVSVAAAARVRGWERRRVRVGCLLILKTVRFRSEAGTNWEALTRSAKTASAMQGCSELPWSGWLQTRTRSAHARVRVEVRGPRP